MLPANGDALSMKSEVVVDGVGQGQWHSHCGVVPEGYGSNPMKVSVLFFEIFYFTLLTSTGK